MYYFVKVKVTQSCPTLCSPVDYTVHGILQSRILEWVAFPFSRGSSQPRDRTQVSYTAGVFFTNWATREARIILQIPHINDICLSMSYWLSVLFSKSIHVAADGNISFFLVAE